MKISSEKMILTRRELKQWVTYDPLTGEMRRRQKIVPKTGAVVSCDVPVLGSNNRGYRWLKLLGQMYLVHRLAFLYMTGKHPRGEVDHINGNRQDNRWGNLRDSDATANSRNQGVRKDSTSGVRGVTYSRRAKKWTARISHNGRRISLGYHNDFQDAVAARKHAETRFGYHPNHGRRSSWRG